MSLRTSLPKIVTDAVPGPKSAELLKIRKGNVTDAVGMLAPVFVDRAEGAMVQDVDGNIFVDFVAGIGVLNVGHSHPEVVEAVKAQAEKYFESISCPIAVITISQEILISGRSAFLGSGRPSLYPPIT